MQITREYLYEKLDNTSKLLGYCYKVIGVDL